MNILATTSICRFIGVTFLFFIGSTQAQVCRVSVNGNTSASGATWQQTKNLQSALNNPAQCPEIWVKSGTYYPTASGNRNASFRVQAGVKVFGGFYGTEVSRTQRDYLYNKAVLSGNIGASGDATDNSRHVVYLDGTSGAPIQNSTEIDGFIIRDGYADNGNGGGMVCESDGTGTACSPILRNLEFINNVAVYGGALYNQGFNNGDTRPIIENTVFRNNKTLPGNLWGEGGAIYNDANGGVSGPVFGNVEFTNNQAAVKGGAMSSLANNGGRTQPVVFKGTFSGNSAKLGGAIANDNFNLSTSSLSLYNSTFANNNSQEHGGALYVMRTTTELNNVTLASNGAALAGGGIYMGYGSTTLRNSILWGNSAPSGAQLFNESGQITATDNVIQNDCAGFGSSGSGGSQSCHNIYTGDPQLGSLQMNRGFTQTMLPGIGSSAIDNGDNATCRPTDQRGIVRPQNGQCDIGSVEVLNVCRVTMNGTPTGNGSDWGGHAMDPQTALSSPTCHQVWIKSGTYYPTSGSDRSVSFQVQPGVTVMGGFAGTENNPSERDIQNNPVYLSGNIGNPNDDSDNSYHVLFLDGTQGTKILPNTVIADLEVRHGYGSLGSFDFPNNSGAGLFCDGSGANSACNPYLSNIRFFNNQAPSGSGGAMFNHADNNGQSSPQLVNIKFESNSAFNGGAMYNHGNQGGDSSPVVVNGDFLSNSAANSGGAVYNNAYAGTSRSQFIFGQFKQNTADYGGAVYNSGQAGGINTANFKQLTFTSNQASFDGGAFYSAGWNNGMSKPTLQDITFRSNLAPRGGAMFLNDLAGNGSADINRVTFTQNTATDGGALYNDGENGFSHPTLTNVTFHNNLAMANGGAIYNNGDNGASSPDIQNSTFTGNNAGYGGAMYSSADPTGSSSPTMRHIIMWDNAATTDGDTIYHNLGESNLDDSIIQYGCPTSGFGNANCNNIINSDPLLGSFGLHGGNTETRVPASNSPAIDAGDNNYCPGEDQRGESRPKGLACDIGSVEVDTQGPTDIIFKDGFD
ncbi:hypothetical protein GCM10011365_04160 [Marinicella pacifica]|uniref:Outer membrane repeat protein n=1 Tax=Marinicella pacifica TaxID=1171543 RepID=A0A917CEC2_9GAMM|nr:choice-of-anchor Q domain-containing protein [Marinicella pacifica]GGF86340.1 hypothetical protein GCM10011365_04160 [Marinicella pacifica]